MSLRERYIQMFRRLLPSPFVIAILLTVITFILAWINTPNGPTKLLVKWQEGLWNSGLLAFAFQMMLMLVLGHVLALSQFFNQVIFKIIKPIESTAQAAAMVTFATILVAFFNWGLGLIFGAILARKLGEKFSSENRNINYPLIAAGGYVGLMVWHGGLSGSALAKVAEPNHLREIAANPALPESISYMQTVFSQMNIIVGLGLLIIIPGVFYVLGRRSFGEKINLTSEKVITPKNIELVGAEKLEVAGWVSNLFGLAFILLAFYIGFTFNGVHLGFITPNFINFTLLGLGLLLHKDFKTFLSAVDKAIVGASGILIQFPLYFGILGLMQAGGLIEVISNGFIAISNPKTLPLFTFLSAGLVNIFVPSGGGQWAIQGPILIDAATKINVPLNKMIMALAYGDQLTNMLQPFWALPLLSITGLKAKDILPYTLILFVLGFIIFGLALIIF